MAHELDMSNDRANMAFVGETPWHGLGSQLTESATIETWRTEAGLDWTIEGADVMYDPDGKGSRVAKLKRQVLFRSDTLEPLSVVGNEYNIVQPAEVLEFFRDLTEAGGFKLHTAGSLFGGRQVWALAKIGPDAAIAKVDKIGGFLLLSTSCDGTKATTAKFTTVRVVCNNTLSLALGRDNGDDTIRVPHSTKFKPEAVKEDLGVGVHAFEAFMAKARKLAKVKIDATKALHVLKEGFADAVDSDYAEWDSDKFAKLPTVTRIMELNNGGQIAGDLATVNGTAWGLVNAVTEFYDHHVRAASPSNRLDSAWFGKGDFVKKCVLEQACTLL